ncbi:MAG: flavodoxin family protein [Methanoregula sp.]|jgi:multimeric flavodoxin WrbA
MTKVIAVNGSPRKKWNTATLLEHALEGAKSAGAQTELVHLYGLDYKGCISCFACKMKGGKSYGKCAIKDELAPVLERIRDTDVLILGSPIYFGIVTGEMRSFMERLMFPYLVYDKNHSCIFPKKIPTAFVYTMNVSEQIMKEQYSWPIGANAAVLKMIFGQSSETLFCNETLQFKDFNKVVYSYADPEERRKRHREIFPQDCKRAFDLGVRLVQAAESGAQSTKIA